MFIVYLIYCNYIERSSNPCLVEVELRQGSLKKINLMRYIGAAAPVVFNEISFQLGNDAGCLIKLQIKLRTPNSAILFILAIR